MLHSDSILAEVIIDVDVAQAPEAGFTQREVSLVAREMVAGAACFAGMFVDAGTSPVGRLLVDVDAAFSALLHSPNKINALSPNKAVISRSSSVLSSRAHAGHLSSSLTTALFGIGLIALGISRRRHRTRASARLLPSRA